jgi:phosphate-selective porin OprO/OprP
MHKRTFFLTVFLTVFLSSSLGFADEKDDRIKALELQLEALAKEVKALKDERAKEKIEISKIKTELNEKVENLVLIEPAAGDEKETVKITMNPSPKFEVGNFSFQPFGRIHLDYAFFDDDAADHPNGAEFRRARLGVKGKISKDFGYKVHLDFANEGVNFKDVYMNYTGFDNLELRLGNFKPGFGLEEGTSSNSISFIERAAISSAFGTSEIIGVGAHYTGDRSFLNLGLFNDDASVGSSSDEAWNVSGRLTYAPILDNRNVLHLGAATSYREPDQQNERFDFDSRAENALQSTDSVSANFGSADSALLYGLEAAYAQGSFLMQGEYFLADAERNGGNSDLEFDGGYVQASYILTGENRPYKLKGAKFGRVSPDKPFDPKNGDWGAFEIAARYSHADLSDRDVLGGEMNNYTLGLNWYLKKNLRFMGNVIMVDTDNNAVTPDDDPNIFLLRAQIDF